MQYGAMEGAMKAFLFGALGLAFSMAALAEVPSRITLDQDARTRFLGLNFFSSGRGMHLSPGLITYFNETMELLPAPEDRNINLRTSFTRRWGLNFDGKNVVGLFDREFEKMHVGAIGCVACHSGRAAGQLIVGLGNKNIDVVQMAKDVNKLETWWKALVPDAKKNDAYREVEEDARAFSRYLADERIGNLTQGLVPISFIRGWFYRVHGEAIPDTLRRGQVKVPFLWGYEEKRKVGLFCDGYGDATELGWAVAVELAAGQRPETVREFYPEVKKAEELFNHFLPPKYPFAVNEEKALSGKEIFSRTCARCHGTYEKDSDGLPIFQSPRFIPWTVVRTDDDRILGNTPEFNAMVDRSPLGDLIRYTNLGQGYFAPRLNGVWARFPYLHNGSVPNVAALLTRPELRPQVFSLENAGDRDRFDEERLGLTLPPSKAMEKHLLWQAQAGKRSYYFTGRVGHSNQGHNFYTDLSDDEKRSIVEYLKTL
jgi:hypothetical protein